MSDPRQKARQDRELDKREEEVANRMLDRAGIKKTGHEQVVEDSRKTFYKAMHNETTHMVLELAKGRRFDAVEDALYSYGVYLEMHPDALEVLAAS